MLRDSSFVWQSDSFVTYDLPFRSGTRVGSVTTSIFSSSPLTHDIKFPQILGSWSSTDYSFFGSLKIHHHHLYLRFPPSPPYHSLVPLSLSYSRLWRPEESVRPNGLKSLDVVSWMSGHSGRQIVVVGDSSPTDRERGKRR